MINRRGQNFNPEANKNKMTIEILDKAVCNMAVSIKDGSKNIGTAFKSFEKHLKVGEKI